MRIAIFGGTGFVGSYLIDAMLAADHKPVVMVRPGHEQRVRQREQCEVVSGALDNEAAVYETLQHADATIYNIGILREFPTQDITFEKLQHQAPKRIIRASEKLGIKRFLLMSANGVDAQSTTYQTTKYKTEQLLQDTTMDWTIFRPSVIYGDPRGRNEFATQLAHDIIAPPLPAPLFFEGLSISDAGLFKLSPVHALDVAAAFTRSLTNKETYNKILPLGGPSALTWREILSTLAQTMAKRKTYLPVPVIAINASATLFDRFAFFPITRDQVKMLLAGNTCDHSTLDLLGITPRRFSIDQLQYINENR